MVPLCHVAKADYALEKLNFLTPKYKFAVSFFLFYLTILANLAKTQASQKAGLHL